MPIGFWDGDLVLPDFADVCRRPGQKQSLCVSPETPLLTLASLPSYRENPAWLNNALLELSKVIRSTSTRDAVDKSYRAFVKNCGGREAWAKNIAAVCAYETSIVGKGDEKALHLECVRAIVSNHIRVISETKDVPCFNSELHKEAVKEIYMDLCWISRKKGAHAFLMVEIDRLRDALDSWPVKSRNRPTPNRNFGVGNESSSCRNLLGFRRVN